MNWLHRTLARRRCAGGRRVQHGAGCPAARPLLNPRNLAAGGRLADRTDPAPTADLDFFSAAPMPEPTGEPFAGRRRLTRRRRPPAHSIGVPMVGAAVPRPADPAAGQ